MRVFGWQTRERNESEGCGCVAEVGARHFVAACTIDRSGFTYEGFE